MANNTIGGANAAFGIEALQGNSEGSGNSAFGAFALDSATGFLNTAVGNGAGMDLTGGDNNIYLGAFSGPSGPSAESNTIRIGLSTHTATYVGGIFNAAVSGGPVHVDVNGRLGLFASSRRYKQEIADMGGESDVLQRLRPVSFYYRPEHDDSHQRQYGLIAEEVAEVAPQLVVYDAAGRPQTVAYHLVNAMLLNEVQKQRKLVEGQRQTIERQQALLEELAARLARVEAATIGGGSQP
jgi:hypothetical protein